MTRRLSPVTVLHFDFLLQAYNWGYKNQRILTQKVAMAAKSKFDPELHDENPEWTQRDFAKGKPASEILPPGVMAQFKPKGGRPRSENPKEAVKLRIDADVLAKFRESGPGWQTRINGILRNAVSALAPRPAKRMTPKSTSAEKRTRPKTARKGAR
jgi:uncharacterized protein (DUF4415 family)